MRWEALVRILSDQLEALKTLLRLHEKEKVALCKLDAAMLEEAVVEKNASIQRFNELENRRLEVLHEAGLEGKPLKELAEKAPAGTKEALLALRNELKKTAEKLSEAQKLNCGLILNARFQIEMLMNLLSPHSGRTYGQHGRLEQSGASTFNRRI